MKIKENARPQIIVKNQTELKRPYAYDQFGNLWDLENAINEDVRDFYLDANQKIPLVNKFKGKIYSAHWAIKPNVEINHKGVKLNSSNLIDESIQHLNFKHKIIKQGFFIWKSYKIKITEASEEFRIHKGNMFRADVKASMLDGTPIFIEVVKTSEISEKKENFINQNEFITFIIYIDDAGNQINNKFNIIGNEKLVELTKRIQKGQGKIADLGIRIKEIKQQRDRELRDLPKRAEKVSGFKSSILNTIQEIETRIERQNGKTRTTNETIRDLLQRIEQTGNEIKRIEPDFHRLNNRFQSFELEKEKNINRELSKEQEELTRVENEIANIPKQAKSIKRKIEAYKKRIYYQKNRSRQASTICQRQGLKF